MAGGGPAGLGRNTWIKRLREEDGDLPSSYPSGDQDKENHGTTVTTEPPTRMINIGGKATIWMGKGDRLVIETPGGGAWGALSKDDKEEEKQALEHKRTWEPRGSVADREARQAGF